MLLKKMKRCVHVGAYDVSGFVWVWLHVRECMYLCVCNVQECVRMRERERERERVVYLNEKVELSNEF